MNPNADAGSMHSRVEFRHEGLEFGGFLGLPRLSVNSSDDWTTLSVAQITIPVIGNLTVFGSPIQIPQATLLHVTSILEVEENQPGVTPMFTVAMDLNHPQTVFSLAVPDGSEADGWIAALNGLLRCHLESRSTDGHLRLGAVFTPLLETEASSRSESRISDRFNGTMLPTDSSTAKHPKRSLYLRDRCLLADLAVQDSAEPDSGDQGCTRTYNLAANATWDLPGNFAPCLNSLNLRLDPAGKVRGDYSITGHPLSEFGHLLWMDASGCFQLTTRSTTTSPSLQTSLRDRGGSIHVSAWGWVILAQRIRSLFGTLGEAWSHVATVSATMAASQLTLRESNATPQTLMRPLPTAEVAKKQPTKTRAYPTNRLLRPLHPGSSEWSTNDPVSEWA